ncbi:MAG TPA: ABC transporter permease subunit [Chthonomonadaceae bacterium]|nr:ABC transporter permease subunit [Chthonomonadaceae bacterium]
MSLIARLMPDNPVLTKEMRVRMRGAKAYWLLLGYLGFLALLLLFQYFNFYNTISTTGVGGSEAAQKGGELFLWIIIPQIFLVLFITPAITSGSLTIENEQQTMDMLAMTRLPRSSIVLGKLLSAVAFTALLIVSSLPLLSVCFMLGSVDPWQVVSVYLELLGGSVAIGALGLMWSSISRSTTAAVIMTYISLFLIGIFGAFVFAAYVAPGGTGGSLWESLFRALGLTWFGDAFFGMKSIDGLGLTLLCIVAGMLLTAIATVRLEMWPDRKAYILRGFTLLVISVQLLILNTAWVDWFYHFKNQIAAKQAPSGILVITALLVALVTPIFATGDLSQYEARTFWKYLCWGWTRRGIVRGKLTSGLPFLLLLTLFCFALYAVPFLFVGKGQDIFRSGALNRGITNTAPRAGITWMGQPVVNTATQPAPGGQTIYTMLSADGTNIRAVTLNGQVTSLIVNGVPNGQTSGLVIPSLAGSGKAVQQERTGDVAQGMIALLATVAGLSLFCMFLSIAFRSRWVAMLVVYVMMLLILIIPEIMAGAMSGLTDPPRVTLLVNLYYLNPMQAFLHMSEPDVYWTGRSLWFGHMPMWQVTTWAWIVIGALSFLATLPFVRREARLKGPIPYEELVAEA